MRTHFTLLFIIVTACFQVSGQDSLILVKMNDEAFAALERSDTSVVEKANLLLEESEKSGKPSVFGINAHTILGIVSKDKGYYITSLNHYLKALNQAKSIKDEGRTSACYNNIGTVYQLQNNFVKSREYFELSLDIEETLGAPLQKSIRLYNLGEVYAKMDSFSLALSYFNSSLIIEKDLGNLEGEIYALLGITDVYIKVDRNPDAWILLDEISDKLETHQVEEKILYSKLKGKLLFKEGRLDEALSAFKLAESISHKTGFRIHLLDIYLAQIPLLKKQEKWKEVVKTYDKYSSLKDQLNTLKVKNQLEDLTFQNTLNQKELELKLIQDEKDLALENQKIEKSTSNHRQKVVWFLIGSIIFLVTLSIFGIRKLSQRS